MRIGVFKILLVLIVSLGVLYTYQYSVAERLLFKVGHYTLSVPKKYSLEYAVPLWLKLMPGLGDDSADLLYEIPEEDIDIPGYKHRDGLFKETISGIITVLSPEELNDIKSNKGYEYLWYAKGAYQNREVKYYKNNLYKVYSHNPAKYYGIWRLYRIKPDKHKPMPHDFSEYEIGLCSHDNAPVTASGKMTECSAHVLHKDILIKFDIREQNFDKIDQIKKFLSKEVGSWIKQSGGVENT